LTAVYYDSRSSKYRRNQSTVSLRSGDDTDNGFEPAKRSVTVAARAEASPKASGSHAMLPTPQRSGGAILAPVFASPTLEPKQINDGLVDELSLGMSARRASASSVRAMQHAKYVKDVHAASRRGRSPTRSQELAVRDFGPPPAPPTPSGLTVDEHFLRQTRLQVHREQMEKERQSTDARPPLTCPVPVSGHPVFPLGSFPVLLGRALGRGEKDCRGKPASA
jgi:hypothetical protein